MSKKIKLSQGHYAIVDENDFEKLKKINWHCRVTPNNIYAVTNLNKTTVQMHRHIMNCPKSLMVDHINRNGLDNRKENLRICTRSQNLMNSKKPNRKSTSKYKGVNFNKRVDKWRAEIRLNKKLIFIGYFDCEKEAALAYNNKAKELFKEFANLNKEL